MYEIYLKLLEEKGVKTSDVCKATGIVASTFSDWKKGKSAPKQDKLIKIADYFGVSVEYLMTGEKKEDNKYYINDETAKMAQKIFENKELRTLFDAAQDASPEDLEAAHNVLLALKRKEKNYDD